MSRQETQRNFTYQIPLIIANQSFDIKDGDEVIAHGIVDKDQKKISLTYTDYAQNILVQKVISSFMLK